MSDTFADFIGARSARLLRTAYLLTHDWAMAEDLLQTSLVKAWSALTLTTAWRDHILIRYQALAPGFLHIAVDGVRVTTLEWWKYDNPSGTRLWDTTSRFEWESIPGWKWPAQDKPVTLTFTPEHFTGAWQIGVEHTTFTHCG